MREDQPIVGDDDTSIYTLDGFVRCTHFGADRHAKYPNAFFCHQCDVWESSRQFSKRAKKTQKRYACRAQHTSTINPTHINEKLKLPPRANHISPNNNDANDIITHQNNMNQNDDANADLPSIIPEHYVNESHEQYIPHTNLNTSATTITDDMSDSCTNSEEEEIILNESSDPKLLYREIKRLNQRVNNGKVKLFRALKKIEILERKINDKKPVSLKNGVINAIQKIVNKHYSRYRLKRLGRELAEAVWSIFLFDGVARTHMVSIVRNYLQEHVFTPLKILEAMDVAGGKCNLQALMVLRQVETLSNHPYKDQTTKKKKPDSILPHEWRVREVAKIVHQYADKIIPMTHRIGSQGEVVEFTDREKVIKLIYHGFKIDHVAINNSVDLCGTVDGFQLTKYLTFVMAGVKMIDPRCVNPLTGERNLSPLFEKYKPQSRNLSFPLKIVMGKETSTMYKEEFAEFFDFFYEASLEGQDKLSGWKPVSYTQPCDMSAQQKMLGFGGVCKVSHRFCHCCSCHSKNVAVPNKGRMICDKCNEKSVRRPGWLCYCHSFATSTETEKYKLLLDALMEEHRVDLDKIRNEGILKLSDSK